MTAMMPMAPETMAPPTAAPSGGDSPSDWARSADDCGTASAAREYQGSDAASTTPARKHRKDSAPHTARKVEAPKATVATITHATALEIHIGAHSEPDAPLAILMIADNISSTKPSITAAAMRPTALASRCDRRRLN